VPLAPQRLARPLRVAIVAPSLRQLSGGQEVQANLLLHSWSGDPAVSASFIASNPPLPPQAEKIPYLRTILRFPFYLASLFAGLRDVDIAHIFSAASTSFLLCTVPAYCVARMLGKKTVIHYHSARAEAHMAGSPFAPDLLRAVDFLAVPSGYLVEIFTKFDIDAGAVPNVVDLTQFSYRQRDSFQPRLLCSRNLEPWYGIETVVQAFAEIKQAFPSATLVILGSGSQENKVRALVSKLKLTGINMAGRVTRTAIGRLYDEADILINGSLIDNMPVSIVEAFASGVVVATTGAGGIPHMVKHLETGMISGVGDAQALAANVIRLLREPLLARRIAANAHQQSLQYRWDVVREQWLRLYSRLWSNGEIVNGRHPSNSPVRRGP
jgi:glycosyltransferase involved in cell wall biosynthesis